MAMFNVPQRKEVLTLDRFIKKYLFDHFLEYGYMSYTLYKDSDGDYNVDFPCQCPKPADYQSVEIKSFYKSWSYLCPNFLSFGNAMFSLDVEVKEMAVPVHENTEQRQVRANHVKIEQGRARQGTIESRTPQQRRNEPKRADERKTEPRNVEQGRTRPKQAEQGRNEQRKPEPKRNEQWRTEPKKSPQWRNEPKKSPQWMTEPKKSPQWMTEQKKTEHGKTEPKKAEQGNIEPKKAEQGSTEPKEAEQRNTESNEVEQRNTDWNEVEQVKIQPKKVEKTKQLELFYRRKKLNVASEKFKNYYEVKKYDYNMQFVCNPQPHHYELLEHLRSRRFLAGFWYMFCHKDEAASFFSAWINQFCILQPYLPMSFLKYQPMPSNRVMIAVGNNDFTNHNDVQKLLIACVRANTSFGESRPGKMFYKPEYYEKAFSCYHSPDIRIRASYFYSTAAFSLEKVLIPPDLERILGRFPQNN